MSNLSSIMINCTSDDTAYIKEKFILLVIVLPIISIFGIIGNIFSISIYSGPRMRQKATNYYLLVISCTDLLTISMALLLYSVETGVEYFQNFFLSHIWHKYLKIAFVISHSAPFATVYFSLAATFDRWMALRHPLTHERAFHYRWKFVAALLLFSFAFCCEKYFEFDILERPECDNLAQFYVVRSNVSLYSSQFQIYSVWISSFVSCLIPFCLLLVLNILVTLEVVNLTEKLKPTHYGSNLRSLTAKPREATMVVIFVAFSFLICNFPSFILTLVEYCNLEYLESHIVLYGFCKDTITVLTTLGASLNPLIYVTHSRSFRKELKRLLKIKKHQNESIITLASFADNPNGSTEMFLAMDC